MLKGLMCQNVLAQASNWSQPLTAHCQGPEHPDAVLRISGFVWLYSFCFMCTTWVPVFGRAVSHVSGCFTSALSSEALQQPACPGSGALPCGSSLEALWGGLLSWLERKKRLTLWKVTSEEAAAVDVVAWTHYFP